MKVAAATAVAAAILTVTGVQAPASAALPLVCGAHDQGTYLGFFYHSYYWGAAWCGSWSNPDLLSPAKKFNLTGQDSAGMGQNVGNNSGSAYNASVQCKSRVFYSANYTGSYITLNYYGYPGYASDTLGVVNNENRSYMADVSCSPYP
jgi:hypothetical protein